jgi:hypothetical protein
MCLRSMIVVALTIKRCLNPEGHKLILHERAHQKTGSILFPNVCPTTPNVTSASEIFQSLTVTLKIILTFLNEHNMNTKFTLVV